VDAELPGLAQDVVVDIGHVAHAPGLMAQVPEAALEHVEGEYTWACPRWAES